MQINSNLNCLVTQNSFVYSEGKILCLTEKACDLFFYALSVNINHLVHCICLACSCHNKEDPFRSCSGFLTTFFCQVHIKIQHTEKDKLRYFCEYCGRGFKELHLMNLINVNISLKTFQCHLQMQMLLCISQGQRIYFVVQFPDNPLIYHCSPNIQFLLYFSLLPASSYFSNPYSLPNVKGYRGEGGKNTPYILYSLKYVFIQMMDL